MTALTKKQRKEQKKIDRRNKANQLRRNKKDMVYILYSTPLPKKKEVLFESLPDRRFHVSSLFKVLTEKRRLGGRDGPPHLVTVVSLHAGADASAVTKMLRRETVGGIVHQEQCVSGFSDSFGLILPRFKQRFTFLHQDTGKLPSLSFTVL